MRTKKNILTIITAAGLGLAFGWSLAAQEKPAKQMNDPKEYELYDKYNKAAPKDKPAALDAWKQAFPKSDFAEDRENMYLFAYNDLKDVRKVFDKSVEILKTRPNYYYALYFVLSYVTQLNPLQPADLDTAEHVSRHILDDTNTVFAAANRPDNIKEDQWAGFKTPVVQAAQKTYAWVFIQRKDQPKSEAEITKYLQMDPTQSSFSYYLAQALLAQNKDNPEKAPPALFHFARAAAYDGQNSLPEAQRKTILDFLTRTYITYHGSDQGLPQLLAMAKTNVFPPAGFSIKSAVVIEKEKLEAQAAEDAKNPVFAFWRDLIKTPLLKDDGQAYFDMSLKDTAIPSGANGLMKLKGKLVSQTPATKPKQLVLGVEKPDVGDVTLVFEEALAGNMEVGSPLEFEGTVKDFKKDPFMLTLEVTKDQLVGWEGKNPPPGRGKGAAPKGAPKGTPGKNKAK